MATVPTQIHACVDILSACFHFKYALCAFHCYYCNILCHGVSKQPATCLPRNIIPTSTQACCLRTKCQPCDIIQLSCPLVCVVDFFIYIKMKLTTHQWNPSHIESVWELPLRMQVVAGVWGNLRHVVSLRYSLHCRVCFLFIGRSVGTQGLPTQDVSSWYQITWEDHE